MKWICTSAAVLTVACLGPARPVATWTYEKLLAESDLVVIATPTSSRDSQVKTVIPNMQRYGDDGKPGPIPAIGMETTFDVLSVLKGDKTRKSIVVYHLREAKPENIPNGPMLATFDVKGRRRYLMHLKREADGRNVVVTGQTDSAIGVKDLGLYP